MQFLTVTTLKDPSKMHSGHHTCESFAFVGYEAFEKWAHTKYGSRPADYDAMKEDLAWRMVRGLEKRIPGLSKHIVFYSLGTPLTNEHCLNATRGNLYGIAKSPSQSVTFRLAYKAPSIVPAATLTSLSHLNFKALKQRSATLVAKAIEL